MSEDLGFIEKTLRESGELVKASFGEIVPSQKKSDKSQIVTDIDVASERLIIQAIVKEYPRCGIIAEESGFIPSEDGTFWVADPIDGTSNFANAIPWFGIMIAQIKGYQVQRSGIYLPMTDEMYLAEKGKGAFKNARQIPKPRDIDLSESLVSLCFSSEDEKTAEKEAESMKKLSQKVLNIRSTNSAYDYAYAAEGKLAATINFRNKIWDIAAVLLIAKEAGYHVSETSGQPHHLALTEETFSQNYTIFLANPSVSSKILPLLH